MNEYGWPGSAHTADSEPPTMGSTITGPMTTDDRAARLAEIRQRWNLAGVRWRADKSCLYDEMGRVLAHWEVWGATPLPEDKIAITHAPEDVAFLLAEVERLTRNITGVRDDCAKRAEFLDDWPRNRDYEEVADVLTAILSGEEDDAVLGGF